MHPEVVQHPLETLTGPLASDGIERLNSDRVICLMLTDIHHDLILENVPWRGQPEIVSGVQKLSCQFGRFPDQVGDVIQRFVTFRQLHLIGAEPDSLAGDDAEPRCRATMPSHDAEPECGATTSAQRFLHPFLQSDHSVYLHGVSGCIRPATVVNRRTVVCGFSCASVSCREAQLINRGKLDAADAGSVNSISASLRGFRWSLGIWSDLRRDDSTEWSHFPVMWPIIA